MAHVGSIFTRTGYSAQWIGSHITGVVPQQIPQLYLTISQDDPEHQLAHSNESISFCIMGSKENVFA